MRLFRPSPAGVIVACLLAIAAVRAHSVEDIHYLKSFYPAGFTVKEAFLAALIESVKVLIVSLPLIAAMVVAALLLRAAPSSPPSKTFPCRARLR